jgi:hypothetical protein
MTTVTYKIGNDQGTFDSIYYNDLVTNPRWTILDPEFARRVLALMTFAVANKKRAYLGPTYRSYETQRSQFLNRYYGVTARSSDTVTWAGTDNFGRSFNYWKKNTPDTTTTAPPGQSYHDLVTSQNKCIGVDLMGYESDRTFLREVAPRYGLWMQTDPTDPHHFQPIEVPRSKIHYNPSTHTLRYFNFNVSQFTTPGALAVFPKAPLYFGPYNSAAEVNKLQIMMKYWGWYKGPLRADYDTATATAVRKMQYFLKVPVNGTYNSATDTAYRNFYFAQTRW